MASSTGVGAQCGYRLKRGGEFQYLIHLQFPTARTVLLHCFYRSKKVFQPEVMKKSFCNLYYGSEAKNDGFLRLLPKCDIKNIKKPQPQSLCQIFYKIALALPKK
jgi:hypothetical protein